MSTILSFLSGRQITNDSGVPQAGAKLFHYREGTTTNLTVWTSDAASVAHDQPVVCDAGGFVPLIYVDDTFDWKVLITTSADVTLKTYDNLAKAVTEESSAAFASPLFEWTQVTSAASPVALTVNDVGKAYEADTTGGNIEFDLPGAASVGDGKGFVFKKTSASNTLTLDPNGSETIDDDTSLAIGPKDTAVGIFSNGAEWYKVFEVLPELPIEQISGLTIVNNAATPTTQIDVDTTGRCMLVGGANSTGLRVSAVNVTINAAGTGANGLDTGALANNTWYHVWIINNGSTTAGLLSTSATSPTMPSGYTYKARCGAVRTGGSATFLRTIQKGARAQYQVVTGSTTPNLPIMSSAAAVGSTTVPTWVAVGTGSFVPPTAIEIKGTVGVVTSGAAYEVILAPNDDYGAVTSTSNPPPLRIDHAGNGDYYSLEFNFVLETTDIFWANNGFTAGNGYLLARGWVDAVNAS